MSGGFENRPPCCQKKKKKKVIHALEASFGTKNYELEHTHNLHVCLSYICVICMCHHMYKYIQDHMYHDIYDHISM